MPITPYSSSDLTRSRNNRQIYSGYLINIQANQLGIPAIPTTIKGASGDIVQSLREGSVNFTPTELAAILNNNSGSTAPSGPPGPPSPPPTPLTFKSTDTTPLSFPYTIPASYTLLTFTLIGGGGGGGGTTSGAGGGGCGGAYFEGSIGVTGGSIVQFIKVFSGLLVQRLIIKNNTSSYVLGRCLVLAKSPYQNIPTMRTGGLFCGQSCTPSPKKAARPFFPHFETMKSGSG